MAQIFLDTVTLLGTATAASALNNIYCCQALSGSDVANKVFYPGDATYNESISSYFSLDAQLAPECIIQPTTADDVSTALSVLVSKINSEQSCHFAVRSGGHTCWAGAANIEKGVTIDLSLLNSAIYNEEDSTASVGPGARWASVYEGLAKSGVTIPGGRAGTVGVGGLTLGGGNSFFAAREGFVCDNVANFEIVLASGEIANANSEENADLWHALKGGSNNFGIVTKIDFFAFPFDSLWGGVVAYPGSTASDQISAFVNFNDNLKDDPFASVISIWQSTSEMPELVILNAYEYTKPEPNPPILGEFLAIPGNISDSMRITDLRDVTEELEQAAGTYTGFWTVTFANNPDILHQAAELLKELVGEISGTTSEWTAKIMFQPVPTIFSKHSVEKGGNVLGLDRATENLVLLLLDVTWDTPEEEIIFRAASEKMIAELAAYAGSVGGLNEFIYLDYADSTQNPLRGYGEENLQKLKRVSEKYDPDGVFQTAVPGGFKVSKA